MSYILQSTRLSESFKVVKDYCSNPKDALTDSLRSKKEYLQPTISSVFGVIYTYGAIDSQSKVRVFWHASIAALLFCNAMRALPSSSSWRIEKIGTQAVSGYDRVVSIFSRKPQIDPGISGADFQPQSQPDQGEGIGRHSILEFTPRTRKDAITLERLTAECLNTQERKALPEIQEVQRHARLQRVRLLLSGTRPPGSISSVEGGSVPIGRYPQSLLTRTQSSSSRSSAIQATQIPVQAQAQAVIPPTRPAAPTLPSSNGTGQHRRGLGKRSLNSLNVPAHPQERRGEKPARRSPIVRQDSDYYIPRARSLSVNKDKRKHRERVTSLLNAGQRRPSKKQRVMFDENQE